MKEFRVTAEYMDSTGHPQFIYIDVAAEDEQGSVRHYGDSVHLCGVDPASILILDMLAARVLEFKTTSCCPETELPLPVCGWSPPPPKPVRIDITFADGSTEVLGTEEALAAYDRMQGD